MRERKWGLSWDASQAMKRKMCTSTNNGAELQRSHGCALCHHHRHHHVTTAASAELSGWVVTLRECCEGSFCVSGAHVTWTDVSWRLASSVSAYCTPSLHASLITVQPPCSCSHNRSTPPWPHPRLPPPRHHPHHAASQAPHPSTAASPAPLPHYVPKCSPAAPAAPAPAPSPQASGS